MYMYCIVCVCDCVVCVCVCSFVVQPVSQAQFDAALRILADEEFLTVSGHSIRVC